jgi:hypothetical protein
LNGVEISTRKRNADGSRLVACSACCHSWNGDEWQKAGEGVVKEWVGDIGTRVPTAQRGSTTRKRWSRNTADEDHMIRGGARAIERSRLA